MKEIFDFLNDLADAESETAEQQVLARHLARLGMPLYCYANMGRQYSSPLVVTNFPTSWVRHYAESGYIEQDIVIQYGRKAILPYRWQSLITKCKVNSIQRRIFQEASLHGLHDGLAIPIQGYGHDFAILSLAVTEREFPRSMEANKHQAHLIALHYHSATEARNQPEQQTPEVNLSPREIECLKWISKGKTAWEIAQILKISERTAVYHIENAKRKLGVNTRNHAVAKAITLGLIEP